MARPRKQPPPSGPVTAADVIAFIETVCFVPEGKFVGQPLRLQDWQKDILRAIYDNPHGTRRAIISMGRKNAKTTLSACLLLAHLCGPPARNRPNSELYSAAQIARPGGDHLLARGEDGAAQSDAGQRRAHHGNRQDARLPRAWHALSGAVGRGDDGFRPVAEPDHPRRAGPRSRAAVAVVRGSRNRGRGAGGPA